MRVLVVEDEPTLNMVLTQALREVGYAVDAADNGREALYKATTWPYDVILLDVMLPGLDGWQILTQLRRTHQTPVLMLTARDSVPDRVRGLDVGADDYVVKPFSLAEVLARVRALIRRSAGLAAGVITIGNVVIDTSARLVTLDGGPIVLTGREYAILEMLALQRGKVVTKSQIYDHICDENDDTFSNLIEVHVSNLRKKLGKDLIATRRGLGYVIDGP
jgi:two-component system OmpR family response regulator